MKVLAWVAPDTWESCVAAVRGRTGPDDEVTLVVVLDAAVLRAGGGAAAGLLGRGRDTGDELRAIWEADARALLDRARSALGTGNGEVRTGRPEHVLAELSARADLLVMVRDGGQRPGPDSLDRVGRFVVDHATCAVLLLPRPDAEPLRLPPEPPGPPDGAAPTRGRGHPRRRT